MCVQGFGDFISTHTYATHFFIQVVNVCMHIACNYMCTYTLECMYSTSADLHGTLLTWPGLQCSHACQLPCKYLETMYRPCGSTNIHTHGHICTSCKRSNAKVHMQTFTTSVHMQTSHANVYMFVRYHENIWRSCLGHVPTYTHACSQ